MLIVEDVEIVQKIASMVLENLGMTVDVASDGETGLDLFQQRHKDKAQAMLAKFNLSR